MIWEVTPLAERWGIDFGETKVELKRPYRSHCGNAELSLGVSPGMGSEADDCMGGWGCRAGSWRTGISRVICAVEVPWGYVSHLGVIGQLHTQQGHQAEARTGTVVCRGWKRATLL